jgi:hypothetical protein
MADEEDIADATLELHLENSKQNDKHSTDCCVYLGEVINYDVVVRKPAGKDSRSWRRRVSQLFAQACVQPVTTRKRVPSGTAAGAKKNEAVACTVVATYADEKTERTERLQVTFANRRSISL